MMGKKILINSLLPLGCGVAFITMGVYLVIFKPQYEFLVHYIGQRVELREGNDAYRLWQNIDLKFKVYLFHITNPYDVIEGETPKFIEKGPYVYDEHIRKEILDINEETDEIEYNLYRTFRFNKGDSGDNKETDKVTMLNTPYVAMLGAIAAVFPAFIPRIGPSLSYLFPDMDDIFLRTTVKEILFDGLPVICDKEKYKDLSIVCSQMQSRKSLLLQPEKNPGEYRFSLLQGKNGTVEGPYKAYRGKIDNSKLGVLSEYKTLKQLRIWNTKECNLIHGSDSITWAPIPQRNPRVYVFIPDICRVMFAEYVDDVVIEGLNGYLYRTSGKTWDSDEIECYCPINKQTKTTKCLPRGLLDLMKCQDVPIFASEPHFTNGDESLLEYADGLTPNNDRYSTFIVIEPLTGAPLSGSKKLQINVLLAPEELEMLSNVSRGYFPIVWIDEGAVTNVKLLAEVFQVHRALNIVTYLVKLPFVFGLFIIAANLWLLLPFEPENKKTSKGDLSILSRQTFHQTFKPEIRNHII